MQLRAPTTAQLQELSTWLDGPEEVLSWGGPGISFPIRATTFAAELNLATLHSYVLENQHQDFVGFGQFYVRLNRCHFGRLIISPSHRGKAYAQTLVSLLEEQGRQELGLNSFSLFVLPHNTAALKTYRKLGFKEMLYPEKLPLEGCLYMIRD